VDKLFANGENMNVTETANIWNKLLQSAEQILSKPIHQTLSTSTIPILIENRIMIVGTKNDFLKDWLSEHSLTIINSLIKASGISSIDSIKFVVSVQTEEPQKSEPKQLRPSGKTSFLNTKYTFDTFVVGHGNRFAHAASLAVAESPAKAYNPLFIYGGVGLGKTHLMQAIANHVMKKNQNLKILYVTTEMFTNEVIGSIRFDKMDEIRNRYRSNIDLLLIDDMQFISGKERTQEEFFHTFNTLYESGKQVVISSDRPPKEIVGLEERLRSRFEWGLTADIQSPDLETRIAILQKKADEEKISVADEVINLIATRVTSNIRELEGALIKVTAYAGLNKSEINAKTAEIILKDMISPVKDRQNINIDSIKKAAAEYYSLKIDDFSAKIRTKEIAFARQVAMYLARKMTNTSLPKIGLEFGKRDHTTVMHACKKIKNDMEKIPEIKNDIDKIVTKLNKNIGE